MVIELDSTHIIHGAETTHYMLVRIPGTHDAMKIKRDWVSFPRIGTMRIDFSRVSLISIICAGRPPARDVPQRVFSRDYPGLRIVDASR